MEILTTLLVILTVIQPFICLHPVIIWSQDSNQNSTFLLLIILIWFLPVCVHVIAKAILSPGFKRCQSVILPQDESSIIVPLPGAQETRESQALSQNCELHTNRSKRYNHVTSKVDSGLLYDSKAVENPEKCSKRKAKLLKLLDLLVQVMQLSIFLVTFSIVTHHIVHLEFGKGDGQKEERENLQDFVLPAIISVFVWMMSISFLLLSLVLEESRKETPRLVFKDQNLESARNLLRQSLRRRLHSMDRADGLSLIHISEPTRPY